VLDVMDCWVRYSRVIKKLVGGFDRELFGLG
jgi:hypothetical protein